MTPSPYVTTLKCRCFFFGRRFIIASDCPEHYDAEDRDDVLADYREECKADYERTGGDDD